MRFNSRNPELIIRRIVHFTLGVMIAWGLISICAVVRPFWVDEWRIIYNLKFKTPTEIWGELAFMQQFPRLYLWLIKLFTSKLEYSYFSLRVIPFFAGILTIFGVNILANKLYPNKMPYRFLLVMMLLSCSTFTEYFVEIKQYTAELLMCVVAILQLNSLIAIAKQPSRRIVAYILLCLSFGIAPFFSYTYPLVVAPIYIVVLIQDIVLWRRPDGTKIEPITILKQWLPLFICTFSGTLFYIIDVSQLSKDTNMHNYWAHLMMQNGFSGTSFIEHLFHFFAQAGSGFLFWWLFGLSGTAGFIFSLFRFKKYILHLQDDDQSYYKLYSTLVILLCLVLYIAGKLPLGEPRLNAFAIPSIAILLIGLLDWVSLNAKWTKAANIFFYLLITGLTGNIFTTISAAFTDSKYDKRMSIYRNTEASLKIAHEKNIPILITPGVSYPYELTENLPERTLLPGDWILKTFPAYKAEIMLPVYAIPDTMEVDKYLKRLPKNYTSVLIGDGISYRTAKIAPKTDD